MGITVAEYRAIGSSTDFGVTVAGLLPRLPRLLILIFPKPRLRLSLSRRWRNRLGGTLAMMLSQLLLAR